MYKDIGADGLKPGHTEEAGYSLLGSVKRGDRRVIVVLSGLPSMKARAQESRTAYRVGVSRVQQLQLFTAGAKVEDADVWLGAQARCR